MADHEVDSACHNLHDRIHAYSSAAYQAAKKWASATFFLFFFILFVGSFIALIDILKIRQKYLIMEANTKSSIEYPLKCSNETIANTCKVNYPVEFEPRELSDATCPQYFRWIHEDLRPWKSTGIWRDTQEKARDVANFRLVIVNGKAYVETFRKSYQTRDLYTIWGILQLLRLYPGRVPDLELMFGCGDMPAIAIHKRHYQGPNATLAPALFQYSSRDSALGVVFPDWSFWGWAELHIKPWEEMLKEIRKGSKRIKWKKRAPYAYWKGNPYVSTNRVDLMKCNVSLNQDWNARLFQQDWHKEIHEGYKHSKLQDQCDHRYKIYVEGRAWSVSAKYILACDSMVLLIKPEYYDFFMRGMVPMQHYWPISQNNKCKDIKFAVEWGNKHPHQAQAIGKGGSTYIKKNLKMEYVYGYMFHLLKEYAKLLKFKPKIPQGAKEVCAESMACSESGLRRKFMEESMVRSPSHKLPCGMPPPYDPSALQSFFQRKENFTRQVMVLEDEYWENINNKQ